MDGARPWQSYVYVTLPMLLPTLIVVTIIFRDGRLHSLRPPLGHGRRLSRERTLSLVIYMYFEAFQKGGWAFGGAVAVHRRSRLVTWIQRAASQGGTEGALMAVSLDTLDFDAIAAREQAKFKGGRLILLLSLW